MQCQATSKRSGEQCKRAAVPGRRVCAMHGGKSLSGPAHPNWKHGRYSRHLPSELMERYEAGQTDVQLLALRDELALVDTRIGELLVELESDRGQAGWREIMDLVDRRRKLVLAECKTLVALGQTLTVEQAEVFVAAVTAAVKRHVTDRDTLAAISDEIVRLATLAGRPSPFDDARASSTSSELGQNRR